MSNHKTAEYMDGKNPTPSRVATLVTAILSSSIAGVVNEWVLFAEQKQLQVTREILIQLELIKIFKFSSEVVRTLTSEQIARLVKVGNHSTEIMQTHIAYQELSKLLDILRYMGQMSEPAKIMSGIMIFAHVITKIRFSHRIDEFNPAAVEAVKLTLFSAIDMALMANAIFVSQVVDVALRGGAEYLSDPEYLMIFVAFIEILYVVGHWVIGLDNEKRFEQQHGLHPQIDTVS